MLWLIFAVLLGMVVAGFFASSTLVGGVIGALVALGINRIRAVSSLIRRYQLD